MGLEQWQIWDTSTGRSSLSACTIEKYAWELLEMGQQRVWGTAEHIVLYSVLCVGYFYSNKSSLTHLGIVFQTIMQSEDKVEQRQDKSANTNCSSKTLTGRQGDQKHLLRVSSKRCESLLHFQTNYVKLNFTHQRLLQCIRWSGQVTYTMLRIL